MKKNVLIYITIATCLLVLIASFVITNIFLDAVSKNMFFVVAVTAYECITWIVGAIAFCILKRDRTGTVDASIITAPFLGSIFILAIIGEMILDKLFFVANLLAAISMCLSIYLTVRRVIKVYE